MAKAKTKAKRKPLPKTARPSRPPKDTRLINECVIYVQSVAAAQVGFDADPDGDSAHASPLAARHNDRSWRAINIIKDTPAQTPDGLCAKARIVAAVFQENGAGVLGDVEEDFITSFAAEVKKFLQPICDGTLLLQPYKPEVGTQNVP